MLLHRILLLAIVSSYAMGSQKKHQELIEPFSLTFYFYVLVSTFLSCFAGVCSGLTVGYMSISKQQMQLKAQSEDENEKKIGEAILSVLQNHHLLLSTLLLSNALALQALPIFLDKIVPGYIAVIISTAAVVIFGEVIPQAYCTGPAKVKIGYFFTPFLKGLEWVLYPLVRPITWILDNWIGHHQDKITLTKENLKALLFLHNKRQYGYKSQEIQILQNTLDLRGIDVGSCMIPLDNVFMMDQLRYVDADCISEIEKWSFSKIPVYSGARDNVVGVIKVKNMLKFNINEAQKIKQGKIISQAVKLNLNDNLLIAIDKLKSNKINFAIVQDQTGSCKGIITLKQIFQKIILKQFKDDDVRLLFNWNKPNVLGTIAQSKQQD